MDFRGCRDVKFKAKLFPQSFKITQFNKNTISISFLIKHFTKTKVCVFRFFVCPVFCSVFWGFFLLVCKFWQLHALSLGGLSSINLPDKLGKLASFAIDFAID